MLCYRPLLICTLILTSLLTTMANAVEPVVVFLGSDQPPAPGPARAVVIALPGIGGSPERGVFLRLDQLADGSWQTRQVRTWQFQPNLQPSHIRKLERTLNPNAIQLDGDRLSMRGDLALRAPRQAGQAAVAIDLTLDLQLEAAESWQPPILRTHFSDPPWRLTTLALHGQIYAGRVTGTIQRDSGDIVPIDAPAYASSQPRGGNRVWVTGGEWPTLAAHDDTGLMVRAVLPDHPVDSGEHASATTRLNPPVTYHGHDAVSVTYQTTGQAQWSLLLGESPSTTYRSAAVLTPTSEARTVTIPLANLAHSWGFDMNWSFTPGAIHRVGVMASAGSGPGTSSISIERITLVDDPTIAPASRSVSISVDPTTARVTNGSAVIQPALFGVHGVADVPADRVAGVRTGGISGLRVLTHSSFAANQAHARSGEMNSLINATGVALDDVIHTVTRSLFDPPPWSRWQPSVEATEATMAAFGAAYADSAQNQQIQHVEFWNEPFMWSRHFNRPDTNLTDPDQHGHYPGPVCADHYSRLVNAFAEAAHAEWPELQIGGPSSAAFHSDNWRHLTDFVMPVVARSQQHLAWLTEHHYMGRGQQYPADYLVYAAMCQAQIGRVIPIWNTECNDLVDQPGGWERPLAYQTGGRERKRATYQLAEILSILRYVPHLVRGRAIHMLNRGQHLNRGEALALRFLAPLRGQQLMVHSSDDQVLAVASRDQDGQGWLVIYNDRSESVTVSLDAPHLEPDTRLALVTGQGLRLVTMSPAERRQVTIGPLGAVRYRLGQIAEPNKIHTREIITTVVADQPASGGLWSLTADQRLTLTLPDHTNPENVTELWVVAEGLQPNEATWSQGDSIPEPLPRMDAATSMIQRIPVNGLVSNDLTITTTANSDGWRLLALAVAGSEN